MRYAFLGGFFSEKCKEWLRSSHNSLLCIQYKNERYVCKSLPDYECILFLK